MRANRPGSRPISSRAELPPNLLVALDIGSSRIACAVADVSGDCPVIVAAETAASYGIRCGEIVDLARASESIRIAIATAAERADADVRSVIVGLSGAVKLSVSKGAIELDPVRRCVTPGDIARLRGSLVTEAAIGTRPIHRFDGPFSVGDLSGIENPEGLSGDRLDMQATFLSAPVDRVDNVLKAVRAARVGIEAVSLEPMACSLGSLSPDERNMGSAVLDFGAGAFRAALWEGGRLRQAHVASGEPSQTASGRAIVSTHSPGGGMEFVNLAVARRFRITPSTAERLVHSHGALGENALARLPRSVEVMGVEGLRCVRVETLELSLTLEELLAPIARSLREGLPGLARAHTGGIVLTGGGAGLRGMPDWISKRFGGMHARLGMANWQLARGVELPEELSANSACSLAGLVALGAENRIRARSRSGNFFFSRVAQSLRKLTASF